MKQLFFVRHGQTEWNATKRMQGQWNSDLNELGRNQSDAAGRLLAGQNIQALYSSPLDRARQTAEIVNRYLSLPIEYDDRLKEWDSGDWSGHLYSYVEATWPEDWAALSADPYNYRGPNCENYPDMIRRSRPFLDVLKTHPAQNIAIVSHGMIGKVMVSQLLGLDEAETLRIRQPNDAVFRITLIDEAASAEHYAGGEGPFEGLASSSEN